MLHLSNTRLPILWHLSDTLRSYFSKDRAESLDLWEKVFQKLCVTGLTLSGTGKTYASAFGIRDVIFALPDQNKSDKQERVLCLVHREQIAKQAMETYRKVFGTSKHYGLLSGNSKNYDAVWRNDLSGMHFAVSFSTRPTKQELTAIRESWTILFRICGWA